MTMSQYENSIDSNVFIGELNQIILEFTRLSMDTRLMNYPNAKARTQLETSFQFSVRLNALKKKVA